MIVRTVLSSVSKCNFLFFVAVAAAFSSCGQAYSENKAAIAP